MVSRAYFIFDPVVSFIFSTSRLCWFSKVYTFFVYSSRFANPLSISFLYFSFFQCWWFSFNSSPAFYFFQKFSIFLPLVSISNVSRFKIFYRRWNNKIHHHLQFCQMHSQIQLLDRLFQVSFYFGFSIFSVFFIFPAFFIAFHWKFF